MASMTEIADKFFVACETGKGWEACKAYCTPDATFAAQAEPLSDVKTLQQYCDWMKGLLVFMPDGRYELVSFATDEKRRNVSAYASSTARTPVKAVRFRRRARRWPPTTSTSCSSMATKFGT